MRFNYAAAVEEKKKDIDLKIIFHEEHYHFHVWAVAWGRRVLISCVLAAKNYTKF